VLYVLVAIGFGVFAGVNAQRAEHRLFFVSVALVVVGFAIIVGWGFAGGGFGALYLGALVVWMGISAALAYAIAAVRQRSRRRPFDGT
jgi:hypothetical protein